MVDRGYKKDINVSQSAIRTLARVRFSEKGTHGRATPVDFTDSEQNERESHRKYTDKVLTFQKKVFVFFVVSAFRF